MGSAVPIRSTKVCSSGTCNRCPTIGTIGRTMAARTMPVWVRRGRSPGLRATITSARPSSRNAAVVTGAGRPGKTRLISRAVAG